MLIGNRVFADQDGQIIFQTGEMVGDVLPRKEINKVHVIDLAYGSIDYSKEFIKSIDPITHETIVEAYPVAVDPDKERIAELENQLLIMAEQSTGGIL